MKKIILTSLLFSLATLVNATPSTITISPTILSINENTATGTTIGTASASGGTGPYSYTVADPDKTTFSFEVGEITTGQTNFGDNNFRVRPAGNTDGSNDITIATINFDAAISQPALTLATAINTYNTANGSGVSAEAVINNPSDGTVRLTSWPANLDGATLRGFDTSGNNIAITITSTDITIPTPTSDFFSIDANTGVLESKVSFDFEAKGSYTIVIRATDSTGSLSESFDIIINNIDDVPTPIDITLSPQIVAEHNATATIVGTLATAGGTGPYSYTIGDYKTFTFDLGEVDIESSSAVANNTFIVRAIDGTDEINIVGDSFKYYAHIDSFDTFWPASRLADTIDDDNNSDFSAEYTVNNTSTGTIRLTDWPDKYDGWELIGFTSTVNGVAIDHITITSANKTLPSLPFSIKDDKLITTAVLDKTTQSSYTITINSTDSSSPTAVTISRDFIITVADGPSGTVTEITISKDTITKQAADGATVGLLSTNATDTGRAYALVDNTATFSISGDKLTANNPNTLQTGTISVSISTLNGDNTIFTQSLTITVTECTQPFP